jgi:hypothetical protein
MESRRSRKQREVVYNNGIQSSVLKEISTPRPDGSIPLISFLENVNYSIMELYDFNSRISVLEDNGKKDNMEELVQNNNQWKAKMSEKIETIEVNNSTFISQRMNTMETKISDDLLEIGDNVSQRMNTMETKISTDLLEIQKIASKNKFIEIMKMENDIWNQYYIIHTKLDDYVNEQYNKVQNLKKPAIRSFSDNLKKLIETKIISFDDLIEQTRVELKNNVNETSKKIKVEYNRFISHLTQLSNDMNQEIIEQKDAENMSIEIRMKKESCFNNIYIDLKNKYKVTQLSLQTLYINILSEISNMCSFIFGKIEALLQNGSTSDVQLVLKLDDFTENLINKTEEDVGFELEVKMNHSNREEYEFDLFKQSKKQEKELVNKTL